MCACPVEVLMVYCKLVKHFTCQVVHTVTTSYSNVDVVLRYTLFFANIGKCVNKVILDACTLCTHHFTWGARQVSAVPLSIFVAFILQVTKAGGRTGQLSNMPTKAFSSGMFCGIYRVWECEFSSCMSYGNLFQIYWCMHTHNVPLYCAYHLPNQT